MNSGNALNGTDENADLQEIEMNHLPEPPETRLIVLVVEDNDSERARLGAMLTKLGYGVIEAANGEEALSHQLQNAAELVISDWKMPGVSGLDLCRLFKKEPDYKAPYFIMLTGMDNPVDLIAGMEAGADDFVVKPCTAEELRVRVQAGARIQRLRAQQEHNNQLMRKLLLRDRRAMHRIKADLQVAARVQQDLLPYMHARLDNVAVGALFKPAQEVGGDFFDYFRIGPDHLGFYLLQVPGQGVAAAMLSLSIAYQISASAEAEGLLLERTGDSLQPVNPSKVVAELNRRVQGHEDSGRYFNMIYGVMDLRDGSGTFCQAGCPNPIRVGADSIVESTGGGGMPVGMLDDAEFVDSKFHLQCGHRLILCTEGLLNCIGEGSYESALRALAEPFRDDLAVTADGVIEVIENTLAAKAGRSEKREDIAVLAISRDAA